MYQHYYKDLFNLFGLGPLLAGKFDFLNLHITQNLTKENCVQGASCPPCGLGESLYVGHMSLQSLIVYTVRTVHKGHHFI